MPFLHPFPYATSLLAFHLFSFYHFHKLPKLTFLVSNFPLTFNSQLHSFYKFPKLIHSYHKLSIPYHHFSILENSSHCSFTGLSTLSLPLILVHGFVPSIFLSSSLIFSFRHLPYSHHLPLKPAFSAFHLFRFRHPARERPTFIWFSLSPLDG